MLGSKIKTTRISKNLSLVQLSQLTAIKEIYLEALENENYKQLPDHVYIIGYLNIISDTLSIPSQILHSLYENDQLLQDSVRNIGYSVKISRHAPRNYFLWYLLGGGVLFLTLLVATFSAIRSTGFLFLEPIKITNEVVPVIENPMTNPEFTFHRIDSSIQSELFNNTSQVSKNLGKKLKQFHIIATKETWVLIKDEETGDGIFNGIIPANKTGMYFTIQSTARVYISNALAIKLFIDGQEFRYSKHISPNNTAKFTVQ
ncbi:MAG: helix-turn-helix domain-containing protein [Methylacidiphilales bacterium]|nr:helix-turn-helix domain-containing protein [Candidatus Methylacidiphilales bacterium]